MFSWFNNLKIQTKLITVFLVIISLSIFIGIIALLSQNYIQAVVTHFFNTESKLAKMSLETQIAMLTARRREKDYLLYYKELGFEKAREEYAKPVQAQVAIIQNYLNEFEKFEIHREDLMAIKLLEQDVNNYKTEFFMVVELLEQRGFQDEGLEGQFRQRVHAIEQALQAQPQAGLMIDMLTMRRHEKDYLLRTEEKYSNQLHETVTEFKNHVSATEKLTATTKEQLITLVNQYQSAFDSLVQMDTQIAASVARYRQSIRQLEPLLEQMHQRALADENQEQENIQSVTQVTVWFILVTSLLVITISLSIALFLAKLLSKPLNFIVQGAQLLTTGNMALTGLDLTRLNQISGYQDEIGEIGRAFNTLANYFKAVIDDIVRVSRGLAAGNLHIMPQSEYRGDFLQIKDTLEIVLPDQQRVIEDIIQVSQGLAEGRLQVTPRALYKGDFAQIEIALKTALHTLREVIGDIVRIAQGLADGQQAIKAQAEYRGDFIQIKTALETATAKLAETTNKNIAQDWLKTGQAQLNNQMSGEQDIKILAKSIVTFLTTYLDAKVGLFYLWMESKQTEQQPYLQMIASYAYTQPGNSPPQFFIGEGLIGQAALEKRAIFCTHTPEEYTYIIRSGLSQAVPRCVFISPFLYENKVSGVIELGSAEILTELQQELLEQVMPNIGIAVNTALSRTRMQTLLQQSQEQAEQLRAQQEEMQQVNEELQSQAEELQTQQEELRQTNEQLESRTHDLEQQKEQIRDKNLTLEKTQAEMKKAQQAIEAKAQELELASQYKSEFLANMSHELRTPLNSLLILSQLLAENKTGNLSEKQQEYAHTIHSAGSDLLTLINDILDLSKVESGKMEVQLEEVSLTDFTQMIEPKFRHLAEQKTLAFQIELAPNLPHSLYTDLQKLKQIINNLLSNAFKFTAQGEVKLALRRPSSDDNLALLELEPSKTVAISVIDTGIGVPKDKQQLIFEAFQQADGTTSRRYGGTGLGLSISRQLARLLGGELRLQSEEGKGSTFTLYLPETRRETQLTSPPKLSTTPSTATTHLTTSNPTTSPTPAPEIMDDRQNLKPQDRCLLITEDDRRFANLLMEQAREKGFKCIIAEDGTTGLELAEKYRPHVIMLDIGLPKTDGWTVMERLKDNPEIRHIPVYFMSAADQNLAAKKLGAIGYLLKPVSMEQLTEAFNQIEQFLAKTVKKILVIVDHEIRQQQILTLVSHGEVQPTVATTKMEAEQHLQTVTFDCIIVDVDLKPGSGLRQLEQLHQACNLSPIPIILYAERELTVEEQKWLHQYTDTLTVKAVCSPERLLDEVTLFLHQLEAQLPQKQRQMLKMIHDKTAILTHKQVLLVDDDMRNIFALVSVLEDRDMKVFIAQNGKEALNLLEQHPDIDIVLMDIMMPEMDGYEAMRKIRSQTRFSKLPIIALTAKAMKGDKIKCIDAGANDYIAKPIDTDKLISLMKVWLYR
ncbi:response regulator receiver [Thioploca ingrica]|uniref:histidine kinase n=1 Tax=Thioploca ingrica TaxID=40754 RepID=A0A090BW58_9GAMM|nr:response regulator receiver [Thioploca ingrica]